MILSGFIGRLEQASSVLKELAADIDLLAQKARLLSGAFNTPSEEAELSHPVVASVSVEKLKTTSKVEEYETRILKLQADLAKSKSPDERIRLQKSITILKGHLTRTKMAADNKEARWTNSKFQAR